jgi:hypothetical protein
MTTKLELLTKPGPPRSAAIAAGAAALRMHVGLCGDRARATAAAVIDAAAAAASDSTPRSTA